MKETLLILFAYLIGSIPTGVILARYYGIGDITKEGSGNIGATNVGRVAGKKAGIITLAGDTLKGVIPLLVTTVVAGDFPWLIATVGLVAFLGHIYPLFNNFKGGKGVATALGVFIYISPLSVLAAIAVFGGLVYIWRFVSLGSVVAAGLMPAFIGLFSETKIYIILAVIIGGIVIYRHKENILRLLEGQENKLGEEKIKEEEVEKPQVSEEN
ncbi:MAG: glycerol-3-phosphate 1-O-acyltransferase PlsY [Deltaproteobacteria bacterium]|nr:glycerol-3-phosphate 1-O-acyltransferase PlsY [Deltaproteobacteria bacterium]